ncbi:bifunctional (p)ppGpp synthetase/guanosine-3',5'-bis(diphosphate) 3'-pyrophosphohydrolase [Candidatus Uhrbacteria bacterium]|nr:bifunctional (p)ppGpp synthetase/guanosine-3',5'-bis(diphosphate) 3'-pyrophosphohydrolase [Candidatus Uhrbacteria bacterium]
MPEIVRTFDDLLTAIKRNYVEPDLDLVQRAYDLAVSAHRGEKRLTGDDFIVHPIAVAYKLADMGLNLNVVAAGLLHDVVEDSAVTIEDVQRDFGEDIAGLVASVTKLKKVVYQGVDRYVENMRKMFLAMASDVRVIFIKFADRLHNLQTLYAMPHHKQERMAREVLEIYAPIANRLGMGEMKGELEDLAFQYLQPKEYDWTQRIMSTKVQERGTYTSHLIDQTETILREAGIRDPQIHGRVKRLYSLYKKLKRYGNDSAKIYDLIAIRVVVDDVEDCYAALGAIHQRWVPLPNRIKDYIAQPKPNGYQSLHTTVFCEGGDVAEFQIRTREMHELAEYGVVAHWRYKEMGMAPPKNLRWMEELVQIQKELASKQDFLDQLEVLKIDAFKDRIFVFTPKGDVIDLPEGGTPVDFAYAIHSELGNKCTAARVNERLVNLDTQLTSGDIVEIITDKNRKGPNADWLKFVKTHHARSKIRDMSKRGMRRWFSQVLPRVRKKT